ncbi:hypothetical protein [Acidobacterium sp. S8]|uniref:hypothetical protein n=1 Tax=Acidobacterium sp. S8 TaxID=1641854 RepID=UPI00131EB144|nr:hypothetical protein [Acidobacterium sp. S8]
MTDLERIEARLAEDARRLERCAAIEAAIDAIADRHPGLPLLELAEKLPADEGERLLQMIDELEIWSSETRAVGVQR